MLVSHTKKFIFTKTAKTAGTSVELYFEPYCMPDGTWFPSHERDEYCGSTGIVGYRGKNPRGKTWFNHMPAKRIRQLLGEDIWESYFKFTIIRNPFDRLVSAFHYLENRSKEPLSIENWKFKLRQLKNNPQGNNDIERFRSWLIKGGDLDDRDKYLIDNNICVDYFIKYEQIEDGIEHVCEKLKIKFEPDGLQNLKGGIRPKNISVCEYYDKKTIDIVLKKYNKEIKLFNYSI